MPLIDEQKLQGNLIRIVDLLGKQVQCCHITAAGWANSSLISAGVFFTVDQKGNIRVYDSPGGNLLTADEYGALSKP